MQPMLPTTEQTERSVKFTRDSGFHRELKRRVDGYFRSTDRSPHDSPRMYLKTAVILLWFGASYALLVFAAATWWQGLLASASLALAMGGIGFAIQHDANHGAYSSHRGVNRVMGLALDLLGGSSYIWRWKHNVFHHTYTNLSGSDNDIDLRPFGRLSPTQPRRWIHRFQQFYLWALYGFLVPQWQFVEDFKQLAQARIADHRFTRPPARTWLELLGGKVFFLAWAFALPMLFHPWWAVLIFYATTAFILGVVLSVVFQLAHCVEEAEFPVAPESSWAEHQVQTTVDFAPRSRLLSWYLGGLNFQIEHHLFPKICHVHYPRLSPIVQAVCAEYGVRYSAHDGLLGAVSSHWRFLRRMGRPAGPALAC